MTDWNRTEGFYKQVISLMNKESWHEAISLLKREPTRVESDWRLSWNLGWCYFKAEQFDEAQLHLLQAARLVPDDPTCKWALGNVLLKQKQFKKAEDILEESLRMKESHLTRIALAFAFLSQGKAEEAEHTHLENIRLRPDNGEAYDSYAAFLSDVGRELEAEEMNRRASELRSADYRNGG